MKRNFASNRQERGVALVLVIWAIGVLAFIASQVSVASRLSYSETNTAHDGILLDIMIEGAILRAVAHWDNGLASRSGEASTCAHPSGFITHRITPANARISLNASSEETITELLQRLGANANDAKRFAAALADYRDTDSTPRLFGAERLNYRSLGLEHEPKNAPLSSSVELHYVPGLSSEMIERLRDFVSAQNHNPSLNFNYASPLVREIVSARSTTSSDRQSRRRSNRKPITRMADRSLGAGPTVLVVTVSIGSMTRTVEATLGSQSSVNGRRHVVEYRPIHHYHLNHSGHEPADPCFQALKLSSNQS